MTGLSSLWLPVLLSSALVFIVSAIIHMALPWHKNDYPGLPDEGRVMDVLRPFRIPPGDYVMPRPSGNKDMASPEFSAKMARGPVIIMTVRPSGPISISKNLVQWFLYCVVVGVIAGYVAGRALQPGTNYLQVFRFVGTTAFVAYSVALWQMSIWYSRSWSTTIKETVDGLIYALLTAGMFGWLWPR